LTTRSKMLRGKGEKNFGTGGKLEKLLKNGLTGKHWLEKDGEKKEGRNARKCRRKASKEICQRGEDSA